MRGHGCLKAVLRDGEDQDVAHRRFFSKSLPSVTRPAVAMLRTTVRQHSRATLTLRTTVRPRLPPSNKRSATAAWWSL